MHLTVDIEANLNTFLAERSAGARYASFDYCFNYFQKAREEAGVACLSDDKRLELSCLHLGFYLASWGMMRGSGELLQRSLRVFTPVVEMLAQEPETSWELDVPCYVENVDAVLALGMRIRKAFRVAASDVLVTKTMLGVFGCVPAFDRFFVNGFGASTLCRKALVRIGEYYEENQSVLDDVEVHTLDFATGCYTDRCYPVAKIIDMIFFQEGLSKGSPN